MNGSSSLKNFFALSFFPPLSSVSSQAASTSGTITPLKRESAASKAARNLSLWWPTMLLPRVRAARDGRVIWVSSGGMYARRLSLADPEWRTRPWDGVVAYAETKRMQVVLSRQWATRLHGTTVTSNAMHPGWVDTGAVRVSMPRFHRVTRSILRDAAQGADTIVWLAACNRVKGVSGRFWFDRMARREHWLPGTRETATEAEALWAFCEQDTGTA